MGSTPYDWQRSSTCFCTLTAWSDTGFNKSLGQKQDTYTSVVYAPIIDVKSSDPATVYTTMVRCKGISNAPGQKYSIQTMDQQLYTVAQVKWHLPDRFKHHIL